MTVCGNQHIHCQDKLNNRNPVLTQWVIGLGIEMSVVAKNIDSNRNASQCSNGNEDSAQ
jgi:hypothetical protein